MTIAVDMGRKATKTKQKQNMYMFTLNIAEFQFSLLLQIMNNFPCYAGDRHGLPIMLLNMTTYRNVPSTLTYVIEFTEECLTVFWIYVHVMLCIYIWLFGTWGMTTYTFSK